MVEERRIRRLRVVVEVMEACLRVAVGVEGEFRRVEVVGSLDRSCNHFHLGIGARDTTGSGLIGRGYGFLKATDSKVSRCADMAVRVVAVAR